MCMLFSSPADIACDSLNFSARCCMPTAFSVSSVKIVLLEGPSFLSTALQPKKFGKLCEQVLQQAAPHLGSLEGSKKKRLHIHNSTTGWSKERLTEGQKDLCGNIGL